MAEELKGLIEKINREGIKAAQGKAIEIEADAKRKAERIVDDAGRQAEKIIAEARQKVAKMQEGTGLELEQSGRDMLLALKKEVNAMLDRLVTARLREALSPQEMARIIASLIRSHGKKEKSDIVVSLKKSDLAALEKGLLGELKQAAKSGITLRGSEDIRAGFIISYDGNKSHFDFTDQGLAEYIGSYMKPKLAEILKGTTPEVKKKKRKR
ncbi:hypothetical protein ACFLZ3_00575 [Candidatus Omnitrophota bacterium]